MEVSDDALLAAIRPRLLSPFPIEERSWRVKRRSGCGRYLTATRDIAAGEAVFSEMPLIVATPDPEFKMSMCGEMAAVALQLLQEAPDSPVHLLQEPDLSGDATGSLAGSMRMWTLGMLRALKSGRAET